MINRVQIRSSVRLTVVLLALCSLTLATPFSQGTNDSKHGSEDAYYYQGRKVALRRSETQTVVRFVPDAAPETAIRQLGDAATVGPVIAVGSRAFRIATIPPADRALANVDLAGRARTLDTVAFAAPVFIERTSGATLVPTDEILVQALPGATGENVAAVVGPMGLSVDRPLRGTTDQFVLRVVGAGDVLERARALYESHAVVWAEPNFVQDYRTSSVPNDTRFPLQWHLLNTGQGGGTPGADVHASQAWDLETGTAATIIAIVDDAIEWTHEDLSPNIFVNAAEIPGNSYDDDRNGYVDDVHGWDFAANDNDPKPDGADNHGTAVAGIAAARGANDLGVSGICQRCSILPVKIAQFGSFTSTDRIAEALRYAAKMADVINNSWGGGAPSNALASALQYAATSGRAGKGSVVMSSAGNAAAGNVGITAPASLMRAGTHRFRWTYSKDSSDVDGDDAAWLAAVGFPGGEVVRFDGNALPPGWTTGGDASWTGVEDPVHADEGSCWYNALRSGSIGDSQSSWVEVVKTVPVGDLFTYQYVSSEFGFDGLRLQVDFDNNGTFDLSTSLLSGVPPTGVAYPAAYPESMAVGASSNFDCRSHYSQFGSSLAFLAPGSAGPLNLGIETTDRMASAGYGPDNYTEDFGGTSSASPLAAGIAGLLLSRNPSLTPSAVRDLLTTTADRIGPVTYVNGRNDRYGAGRLNAAAAVAATPVAPVEAPVLISEPQDQVVPSGDFARLSVRATGTALTYQWYRGSQGDMSIPVAGVMSPVFDTPAIVGPANYWVRVANAAGAVDSRSASLTVGASFDTAMRVPHCVLPTMLCDSGWLLTGRGTPGTEPHGPNAIGCNDLGDSSDTLAINRVRVVSVDGAEFQTGHQVRVEVDTVTSVRPGRLELFFSTIAPPSSPGWFSIASLQAPAVGAYTFSATYTLPPGDTQAVRARLWQPLTSSSPSPTTACAFLNNVTDNDDVAFTVHDVPTAPVIMAQPMSQSVPTGSGVQLEISIQGSTPLTFQWFKGPRGDTSAPIPPILNGASRVLGLLALSGRVSYWVRITNALGSVDSEAAIVEGVGAAQSFYEPSLRTQRCPLAGSCVSTGLGGRGTVDRELNAPNTLFASCQDGSAGGLDDESIESIRITSVDGFVMAPGKEVRLDVSVMAFSNLYDFLDLYSAPDATSPVWTYITTLRPASRGTNTLSTVFALPYGPLQAIRARFRYQGAPAPCGTGAASYDDIDDLVFATDSPATTAPAILVQPQTQLVPEGQSTTLAVNAYGASLTYQWFRGAAGDTSTPVAGATSAALVTGPVSGLSQYWVRVTGTGGTVDSAAAMVRGVLTASAAYTPSLRVPACLTWTMWCDSGSLLTGRGPLGPEINAPSTLESTCADGVSGVFHSDESIERLRVYSPTADRFASGSTVNVDVTVWSFSYLSDRVDVYYTTNVNAPSWTLIDTLAPQSGGLQTMSTSYILPSAAVQAVRAHLRYRGTASPCGTGPYDDQDDLVFAVGGPATLGPSSTTMLAPPMFTPGAAPESETSASSALIPLSAGSGPTESDFAIVAARELERDGPPPVEVRSPFEAPSASAAPAPSPAPVPADAADATVNAVFGRPRTLTLEVASGEHPVSFAEVWFRKSGPVPERDDHSCKAYVERATNTLLLVNDAGTELLSKPIGSDGELANGQCAIDASSLKLSTDSRGLLLTMSVRFNREYASNVTVFTESVDADGISSGWVEQETPQAPVMNPSVTAEKSLPASPRPPVVASARVRPQE
jgi:subtilisin family serine protease